MARLLVDRVDGAPGVLPLAEELRTILERRLIVREEGDFRISDPYVPSKPQKGVRHRADGRVIQRWSASYKGRVGYGKTRRAAMREVGA